MVGHMIHTPLVVLDFETTGLRPECGDRIIEVGLVRVHGDRITDRFQSLVNCGVTVPDCIAAYTGITQEMLDAAPSPSEVMREAAAFIDEAPVVAHNAVIDQRFFVRECRHQRVGIVIEPFICTMQLSRRMYPHLLGHSLGELAYRLNLHGIGRAHRAAADAEVTAELLLQLQRDIADMHPDLIITPKLLRELMHVPASQLHSKLQRRCA